eukprot:6365359-Amphidinium_carterae.1
MTTRPRHCSKPPATINGAVDQRRAPVSPLFRAQHTHAHAHGHAHTHTHFPSVVINTRCNGQKDTFPATLPHSQPSRWCCVGTPV